MVRMDVEDAVACQAIGSTADISDDDVTSLKNRNNISNEFSGIDLFGNDLWSIFLIYLEFFGEIMPIF